MSALVLDPKLLLYPGCSDAGTESVQEYLDEMSDWLNGSRPVRLGPAGAMFLIEQFSQLGYPENELNIPGDSRGRIIARQISGLLTGAFSDPLPGAAEVIEPKYHGGAYLTTAVRCDVTNTIEVGDLGIASRRSHWVDPNGRIVLIDGRWVELVLHPESTLESELGALVSQFYQDRRVYVVGGRRDPRAVERLECAGVPAGAINWVEIEKGTSVKIIKQRLAGVQGPEYVVACVTGKIGHAGSDKVKTIADSRGVTYFSREKVGEIIDELLDMPIAR
ncbi:hypothetical protein ACTXJ3_15625 [Brachybacterium paraconglomeratum]|uniref:hypothetical protein n=1 Tax=Brachybacterium paraconglomeratum TaxID=173362 RepID=UPI003FD08100